MFNLTDILKEQNQDKPSQVDSFIEFIETPPALRNRGLVYRKQKEKPPTLAQLVEKEIRNPTPIKPGSAADLLLKAINRAITGQANTKTKDRKPWELLLTSDGEQVWYR